MTLLVGLPESSAGRIRSFSLSTPIDHGFSCSYIIWGMNNRPLGGRSSEMNSHPIDMIIIMRVTRLSSSSVSSLQKRMVKSKSYKVINRIIFSALLDFNDETNAAYPLLEIGTIVIYMF
jgi:hypothetical protein